MLSILISTLAILFTIFFIIGTHEAAHFGMARALGIKVLCFSIGFGKSLLRWRDRSGTEYVIAMIPLGGYVRMLDESEGHVPQAEKKYAFNRQPFYKKFLVVAAGPVSNLICAFLLYWLVFVIGFVTITPIVGKVTPQSIAEQGGLKTNQEILRMDDKPTTTWMSVLFRLLSHTGNQDTLTMEVRNRQTQQTSIHTLDLTHWNLDPLSPDPLASLGMTPYAPEIPLVIGILTENSPATQAGLKLKDKILAINQQKITDWEEVMKLVAANPGKTLQVEIERSGKRMILPVTIGVKRSLWSKTGYLGIGPQFTLPPDLLRTVQYGPLDAVPRAWQTWSDFTYLNFLLFGKLLTGKLSVQSLGGPITIFESAGNALNSGFITFLSFLAFLSIAIGVINIFPIPGLDGGHLVIQTIEWLRGKPLPEAFIGWLYRGGILVILFFLSISVINDIMRL